MQDLLVSVLRVLYLIWQSILQV